MAAGARTRQRTQPRGATSPFQRRGRPDEGWSWGPWVTVPGGTYERFYESMSDTVHTYPYGDSPLDHFKWEGRPPTVSGLCKRMDYYSGAVVDEYQHINTAVYGVGYGDAKFEHRNTGLSDDPALYVNEALAKNNPGSPSVDLAAFIAELRDLPRTARGLGKVSQAPIATSFGVRPLIGDIKAILSLTDSIAARQKQLQKLSRGVQKERLSLAYRKVKDESTSGIHYYSGYYTRIEVETSRRVWAVKSHFIETNPLKPPPKYDTSYVRRLLSSASSIATLWELLPWSWLVDYFVGIQDMINASNGNRVPGYKVSSLCVCVETKTRFDFLNGGLADRWQGGTFRPGFVNILTQKRAIINDPRPGFPRVTGYLTSGQLSNIAQLALAMAGRRL